MSDRWECLDCGSIRQGSELLKAPHPFDADDTVSGCPECKGMEFGQLCDEPRCRRRVSCGTPTSDGYRQTCGTHKPVAWRP